ncbi:MAG: lysophospholipid acyltransferase family protein [Candidatus Binataceae bacterium]|nr:lysophospholipid acyltransferase family protein [Candidatus Binataceae bacterium]
MESFSNPGAAPARPPDGSAHATSAADGRATAIAGGAPRDARPAVDDDGARARAARRDAQLPLSLKDRLLFYLMVGVIHALSLIPDFVLYPLGIAGGFLGYLLDRRHHVIGLKNLAIAFPERSATEHRRILRASYVNLGRGGAEYVRLGGFFYRRLKRRVTYDRIAYWDEVRARNPGRGLLILSAHFGNFELLAPAHALHGHQIGLVHHTQRFLPGDALMTFVRERVGVEIMRKHSAARAVLKALRADGTVGVPFDQNAKRGEAIFVPFFGEPAATTGGLARIVAISHAPVIPAFIVREPGMRSHRIEIQDEVEIQRSADREADVVENTRRFTATIEAIVRRYPEQFLWTHRRYRTRPRGMAPIYPPKKSA